MQKKQYLVAMFTGMAAIGLTITLFHARPVAAQTGRSEAVFTPDGKLELPKGYRRWVFVGAPLTPNGLNNGKADSPNTIMYTSRPATWTHI